MDIQQLFIKKKKRFFIKFNTSHFSSPFVERLFSFAGFIRSPYLGNLSDMVICF